MVLRGREETNRSHARRRRFYSADFSDCDEFMHAPSSADSALGDSFVRFENAFGGVKMIEHTLAPWW